MYLKTFPGFISQASGVLHLAYLSCIVQTSACGNFMSQIIAEPEEILRFAAELKAFTEQVRERMSRLRASFSRLGDTWHDRQYGEFARDFERTMRLLADFVCVAEEHTSVLIRKAQLLEGYLRQSAGGIEDMLNTRKAHIYEEASTFQGVLNGEVVTLTNVCVRRIRYVKRSREELRKLRSEFNSTARKEFLIYLTNNPQNVAELKQAGLSDIDITRMCQGKTPDGWEVHHKLPLDDNGKNAFENLVLIKADPHHRVITNAQLVCSRGMEEGESREVDWPYIEGSIYPKRIRPEEDRDEISTPAHGD